MAPFIRVHDVVVDYRRSGSIHSVKDIYNLGEWRDKKPDALQTWAGWLTALIDGNQRTAGRLTA